MSDSTGPKSDHFDGTHFFNPWNPHTVSFSSVIYWKLTSKRSPWPPRSPNEHFDVPPERIHGSELRVSYVGHSTVLIQTEGFNILTDPMWSERAGPLQLFGPKRQTEPGIALENLPPIDYILISHNHYDHMDLHTIKKILKKTSPKIILPLRNKHFLSSLMVDSQTQELDWFESLQVRQGIAIHLMPTQHWSSRWFFDRNKALWGAFVLSTPNGNLYFCGDSGYGGGVVFQKVLEQFGSLRFAMLPIGAYSPRWFMEHSHMSPEEAVLAFKDLGEPDTLAIHFDTFRLGDEDYHEPIKLLMEACRKHDVKMEKFRILEPGEVWTLSQNHWHNHANGLGDFVP